MAGGAWRAVELHVDLPVPEHGRYSYRSAIFESSTCSPVVTSIRAGSSRKGKGRMQNSRMQNAESCCCPRHLLTILSLVYML